MTKECKDLLTGFTGNEIKTLLDGLDEMQQTETKDGLTHENRLLRLEADLQKLKQRGAKIPGFGPIDPEGSALIERPGAAFVKSQQFKSWVESPGQRGRCAVAVPLRTKAATNIITSAGVPPGGERLAGIVGYPIAPPAMLALIPSAPMTMDKVTYLKLLSRPTPGAASQFPEGSAKAEQSFDIGPAEAVAVTIAAWTSCSTQALSDIRQLQHFLDETLTALTLDEADRQTLLGTGAAAGQLEGLLSQAVPYNTALTLTGDSVLDVISHAVTQLATSGIMASAAVLSPTDAERARLIKTTDGSYVLQQPTIGTLPNLWGLTLAIDSHMTPGSFLVGRFARDSVELLDREQAMVEASREHGDYFVKNLVALRCELRAALACYQPGAFVAGALPATPPAMAMAANGPKK